MPRISPLAPAEPAEKRGFWGLSQKHLAQDGPRRCRALASPNRQTLDWARGGPGRTDGKRAHRYTRQVKEEKYQDGAEPSPSFFFFFFMAFWLPGEIGA